MAAWWGVAFSLISMLVGLLPESAKRKALRKRRARPVVPNHRAELNYLADLLLVVEQCKRAGEDVAAGLRVHWDESLPAADRKLAADAPPPPGAPVEVPSLDSLLEQAARRFGNIDGVAERLAKLAAQRTLGAVDEALAENILKAVGVDISSYLAPDSDIRAALTEAIEANVALIKSIPSQYLDGVRETVQKAFAAGERFESVSKRIAHIGDVTESRARLIARDQVAKMNSAFNEVRQVSVGITHYTWSTSHDERVRPSHRQMNGEVVAWKEPREVDGERVHPGEAVNCFPGDSEVQFAHDVKKAYRRRYSGELAEIVTDTGKTLRATPNHPVLTTRGWLPIGQLNEGDHVIEVAEEVVETAKRRDDERVPLIADIFETALVSGERVFRRPGHEVDFHGDGTDDDVDVVLAARPLVVDHVVARQQGGRQLGLAVTANRVGLQRAALEKVVAALRAANRFVRSAGEFLSGIWRQATHAQQLRFANAAPINAGLFQALPYYDAIDAEPPRDGQLAFAGHVVGDHRRDVDRHAVGGVPAHPPIGLHAAGAQLSREIVLAEADELGGFPERLPFAQKASRVVKTRRIDGFWGHVYNLETAVGWYVTNGIVTHNCRCVAIPVIEVAEQTGGGEEERQAA